MKSKTIISICLGSSCYRRGNQEVLEVVKKYLADHNFADEVEFKGHLCKGQCADGPVIHINGTSYRLVDRNSVIDILDKHLAVAK